MMNADACARNLSETPSTPGIGAGFDVSELPAFHAPSICIPFESEEAPIASLAQSALAWHRLVE